MYKIIKLRAFPTDRQKRVLKQKFDAIRQVTNSYIYYLNAKNRNLPMEDIEIPSVTEFWKHSMSQLKKDRLSWVNDVCTDDVLKDALITYYNGADIVLKLKEMNPFFLMIKDPYRESMTIFDNIDMDIFMSGQSIKLRDAGSIRVDSYDEMPSQELIVRKKIVREGDRYYFLLVIKDDNGKALNLIDEICEVHTAEDGNMTISIANATVKVRDYKSTFKYRSLINRITSIENAIAQKVENNAARLEVDEPQLSEIERFVKARNSNKINKLSETLKECERDNRSSMKTYYNRIANRIAIDSGVSELVIWDLNTHYLLDKYLEKCADRSLIVVHHM